MTDSDVVELTFSGTVFEWRGPSPYYYVAVPEDESEAIGSVARSLTYGWGVIPVRVRLGGTRWRTSLFPRDGGYLVPLKLAVRRAEGVADGEVVTLTLSLEV